MAKSDVFKAQHKEILNLVGQLAPLAPNAATKASDIRSILGQLAGKVSQHLAMEDMVLYKNMLANPTTKSVAERFQREMGGIASVFTSFVGKYASPAAIQANPAGFASEFSGLVKALGDRVKREESELYAAFDKS